MLSLSFYPSFVKKTLKTPNSSRIAKGAAFIAMAVTVETSLSIAVLPPNRRKLLGAFIKKDANDR